MFSGNQYEECRVDEGHWTAFDIKCSGWMLQTQFNFGRKPGYQQSVLGYWHNVCTQERAPHHAMPEVMYPVAHLCRGVRWPCSSEWEYLTEDDVELACDETFKYCRRFFEAAPRLLKGLEHEKNNGPMKMAIRFSDSRKRQLRLVRVFRVFRGFISVSLDVDHRRVKKVFVRFSDSRSSAQFHVKPVPPPHVCPCLSPIIAVRIIRHRGLRNLF